MTAMQDCIAKKESAGSANQAVFVAQGEEKGHPDRRVEWGSMVHDFC